jgi:site-specific DNA-methyltransferase (adenine-specific)
MQQEAAAPGLYEPEHLPGLQFAKLQVLTIKELLAGKEVQYPRLAPAATFRRAARRRADTPQQQLL